jgi:hypothetical protein
MIAISEKKNVSNAAQVLNFLSQEKLSIFPQKLSEILAPFSKAHLDTVCRNMQDKVCSWS